MQRDIVCGYGTVTKTAMQDRDLTIQAKAIYAYLCSYAGGKDEAHPGIAKICYDLCVDERTLRKHMKLLIEHGYVRIDRYRYAGSMAYANNHYIIIK